MPLRIGSKSSTDGGRAATRVTYSHVYSQRVDMRRDGAGRAGTTKADNVREHSKTRGSASADNLEFRIDERTEPTSLIVAGSSEAVTAQLLEFMDFGFTGFNFIPAGPDPATQMKRLARDVVPVLRAAWSRKRLGMAVGKTVS